MSSGFIIENIVRSRSRKKEKCFKRKITLYIFQNNFDDKMGKEESPVLVRKRSCIKRGERKKSECSSA